MVTDLYPFRGIGPDAQADAETKSDDWSFSKHYFLECYRYHQPEKILLAGSKIQNWFAQNFSKSSTLYMEASQEEKNIFQELYTKTERVYSWMAYIQGDIIKSDWIAPSKKQKIIIAKAEGESQIYEKTNEVTSELEKYLGHHSLQKVINKSFISYKQANGIILVMVWNKSTKRRIGLTFDNKKESKSFIKGLDKQLYQARPDKETTKCRFIVELLRADTWKEDLETLMEKYFDD